MLKTFIAEIKEEVASRAGETNDALIGLRAAVTIGREQIPLITKVRSSKKRKFLYKIFTFQSAAR